MYIYSAFTVCIGFLNKFVKRMKEREVSMSDENKVEVELMKACDDAKGKDSRFVSTIYNNYWLQL